MNVGLRNMNKEGLLYPKLSEQGKKEVDILVKHIVERIKIEFDNSGFYESIANFIETDSWQNFRNSIMDGMNDYSTGKAKDIYDFKNVRKVMLRENYDQIIKDLNQDSLEKIKSLERTIEILRDRCSY